MAKIFLRSWAQCCAWAELFRGFFVVGTIYLDTAAPCSKWSTQGNFPHVRSLLARVMQNVGFGFRSIVQTLAASPECITPSTTLLGVSALTEAGHFAQQPHRG